MEIGLQLQHLQISPIPWKDQIQHTRPRPCTNLEDQGNSISTAEVIRLIGKSNKSSAGGADGFTNRLLHRLCDCIAPTLSKLFETCRSLRYIPTQWKTGHTILIYKKDDPSQIKNWRPICLNSAIYKLYSGIITNRLYQHNSLLLILLVPGLVLAPLFSKGQIYIMGNPL